MKFIHKKWAMVGMLAVFSLAPLFAVHQSTSAATLDTGGGSYVPAEYANVKAVGWTFWVDGNQQEINTGNFTQIIANKNQAGQDQYSVFAYSKTKNGNVKEYVQRPDYYGHSGETQTCADHIDYNTTTGDTTLWMHSNNCSQVTGPGITLARDIPADILEKASRENFGQEPLGCPSFDPIPANQTGLSYNCPDNKGSVKNGVYSATETIEPTPTTPDTIEETSPCEGATFRFGWLICGITELADGFIGGVEKALRGLLVIDPSTMGEGIEKDGQPVPNPLKTAWSAVRIVATVVLVGVALFMIIAQILSLDIFSAYTVKKVVPRLVIAAILMQLSWYLFTGLIVVVNTVGIAISDVMMAPFGGKNEVGNITEILSDFYANNGGAGATVNLAINAGVVGGIAYAATHGMLAGSALAGAAGNLGVIMLFSAIGVAIVLFIGLSVLIMRQVGIIALLVVSPLALVAWILPGTQNFWRQWWQLFSKLLLMFPLIFILLTSGKILAWIIANSHWSLFEGVFTFFMILIAYFGPFLLIPTTFAIAGGLFAKMVGKLDGLGKGFKGADFGGFGAQRKANKEAIKEQKAREARAMLGDGKTKGFKRLRAQMRTGTLGYGSTPTAQEAYRRRERLALLKGQLEFNEQESLEDKLTDSQAEFVRAGWVQSEALNKGELRPVTDPVTGTVRMEREGRGEFLVRMATTGTKEEVRAAMQEIIKVKDAGAMDKVERFYENPNNTASQEANEEFAKRRRSTDFGPAFAEKRGDLVKGKDVFFGSLGVEGMAKMHKSAVPELKQYLTELQTSDPAQYQVVVNRLGASINELTTNPVNSALAASNPDVLQSLKQELEIHFRGVAPTGPDSGAAKGLDATINHIADDGSIK